MSKTKISAQYQGLELATYCAKPDNQQLGERVIQGMRGPAAAANSPAYSPRLQQVTNWRQTPGGALGLLWGKWRAAGNESPWPAAYLAVPPPAPYMTVTCVNTVLLQCVSAWDQFFSAPPALKSAEEYIHYSNNLIYWLYITQRIVDLTITSGYIYMNYRKVFSSLVMWCRRSLNTIFCFKSIVLNMIFCCKYDFWLI